MWLDITDLTLSNKIDICSKDIQIVSSFGLTVTSSSKPSSSNLTNSYFFLHNKFPLLKLKKQKLISQKITLLIIDIFFYKVNSCVHLLRKPDTGYPGVANPQYNKLIILTFVA